MITFVIGCALTLPLSGALAQHDHGSGGSSDRGGQSAQDPAPPVALNLPLKGLKAPCCSQAVEQAFKRVKTLSSVKVAKTGDRWTAEIVMKPCEGLPLSEVKKALEAANRSMGKSMGTTYELDGGLTNLAYFYRTGTVPDEAKLRTALSSLKGYRGLWVKKTGFAASFGGEEAPSVDEISKASRLPVLEVILAPSADGKRYACPAHPEKVSASEKAKCPLCGKAMAEVEMKE